MAVSIRIMFVGQGASDLPEDRFVNVFHFHSSGALGTYEDYWPDLAIAVHGFYTDIQSGTNKLSDYISPWVKRSYQTVAYDLTQPPPRAPSPATRTLGTAVGNGLMEEASVCLTLHGDPPITPRRRGRIYVGPLTNSSLCLIPATTVERARVDINNTGSVGKVITTGARNLINAAVAVGVPWCIRSTRPAENFVPITGGWVDDAFDTQRRRGPDPVAKTLIPA